MNDRMRLSALLPLLTIAAFGQDSPSGAPYSAEEVTESVQTLADGTHVTQPSTSVKIYRDSEGRTRTEHALFTGAAHGQTDRAEGPAWAEISDPVAHVRYTFFASEKVAHKLNIQAPESRPAIRAGTPFGSATLAQGAPPPSASRETRSASPPRLRTRNLEAKPLRA